MAPAPPETSPLVDGLIALSFVVHDLLGRIAANHELSLTQLRLLRVLHDHQPGILKLAECLSLRKSSVSGLVDRAEALGLVLRTASVADGRARHVTITSKGRALSRQVAQDVEDALNELTTPLSTAEQARLAELLRHIVPSQ